MFLVHSDYFMDHLCCRRCTIEYKNSVFLQTFVVDRASWDEVDSNKVYFWVRLIRWGFGLSTKHLKWPIPYRAVWTKWVNIIFICHIKFIYIFIEIIFYSDGRTKHLNERLRNFQLNMIPRLSAIVKRPRTKDAIFRLRLVEDHLEYFYYYSFPILLTRIIL